MDEIPVSLAHSSSCERNRLGTSRFAIEGNTLLDNGLILERVLNLQELIKMMESTK